MENTLSTHAYPILEFDAALGALINPRAHDQIDLPEHAVACFFQDVIIQLQQDHQAKVIHHLRSEIGLHPIYEIELNGQRLAVFHPGVGAPLAAGMLEGVIALGGKKFMACGGAGVLDSSLVLGHVVVPNVAIRDEGTSYHYLPPAREVTADPQAVAVLEQTLQAHQCPYIVGKTWTTDAIYRETPEKVRHRRAEGCLTVEMETATFLAVAQFRNVSFAQLLYSGDDLSGEQWDSRDWTRQTAIRERLFWLAAEACLLL